MKRLSIKYPKVAHIGHNVSHAKNRTAKLYRYNLHNATVVIGGVKQKVRVPVKLLRQLKKASAAVLKTAKKK